jgi:hypothetical protein
MFLELPLALLVEIQALELRTTRKSEIKRATASSSPAVPRASIGSTGATVVLLGRNQL